jgi:LmbE family N-acetylglucosaminyl deacetylase
VHIGLLPAQRILVIAPHPDDESLGCGGTIVRYVTNGAIVNLLVVSDGAAIEEPDGQHDDIVAVRRQELESAVLALGIHHVQTLQIPDGQLDHYETQIHKAISDCLTTFQPDLVLAPSLIDGHVDHVTVGRITLQLLRTTPGWTLAFYEVLAPLRFNTLIDITDVAATKEKAICCYQRSLFQQPQLFWEAFRSLNVAKSAFVHRAGLFEAFWVLRIPPTDQEVLDWVTYAFQLRDDGPSPLRRVKGIDDLVFAVQEKTRALANAELQIGALRDELAEIAHKLHSQETLIATLQQAQADNNTVAQTSQSAFLNRATKDGHSRFVTLSETKGLSERFFAALRMTRLWGCGVRCTNILRSDSARERGLIRRYFEYAFPVGSPRRAALSVLKRRLAQYTSKSPKE